MPLQLIVHDEERTLTFPLVEGELVLGSGADCDLRIGHPTISRRHALLRVSEDAVELEDLGSRNGTRIDGRRLASREPLPIGTVVVFGTLEGRLEEVGAEDLVPAVSFDMAPPAAATEPTGATTSSVGSLRVFTLEHLPRLLERLDDGDSPTDLAQQVGAALFETLPCDAVEVIAPAARDEGVLFHARHEVGVGNPVTVEAEQGPYLVRVVFRHATQARSYEPLVHTAARLVRLADRRHRAPARSAGAPVTARPPDPPTVVPAVRALYRDATRVARGEVGVLITGESGTGKEVLARFLHASSPRRDRPFVALNCAALPRDLLEAELFGIEEGVATGVKARAGKFELAHGGTFFLDEIGDMAPATQAKILRVLQEGEVYRLGGQDPRPANVRILAATNRDIDAMMAEGDFRSDLYHRIADWRAHLPPLRERREDIPNLAAWFLQQEAARQGVRVAGISRAAIDALLSYHWPGNLRQLDREMARAVLFVEDGQLLQSSHLQAEVREGRLPPAVTLREKIERLERREIETAIGRHEGNLSAVARELDIGRSTLYRRMKELGLDGGAGEEPAVSGA